MAYTKTYTPQSITLISRPKAGRVYLLLSFHYGYNEIIMTPSGFKVNYRKFTTGVGSLPAKYWVDGEISPSYARNHRTDYANLIKAIEEKRAKVWAAYCELTADNAPKPSPETLSDAVSHRQAVNVRVKFADYVRQYAQTVHENSPRTKDKYLVLARLWDAVEAARAVMPFRAWAVGKGEITLGGFNDADWQDMCIMVQRATCEVPRVMSFHGVEAITYAPKGESGDYAQTTLEKFQQNTRSVLNYAIKKNVPLRVVPTALAKVPRGESEKACLSLDQVGTLVAARFSEPELENARKLFVLQCFMGVAVSDLENMVNAPIDIIRGRQIVFRAIKNVRTKTATPFCCPLLGPAWEILSAPTKPYIEKYQQQYNDHLKLICRRLQFDNVVTLIVTKADGQPNIERKSMWEAVSSHMGRAWFKMAMEEEAGIRRDLVAQVMSHKLDSKSADAAYRRMSRERKAELFLLQLGAVAAGLPFPVMPPPVVAVAA